MTFLPDTSTGLIQGIGKANADIMIVGDCPSVAAIKEHKPIAPPVETVLEGCLHQAGLIKSEVFITNLIKDDTRVEKYWKERTKQVLQNIDHYVKVLEEEIKSIKPKVIVTMGELPSYVLTGNGATTKTRGYPFTYREDTRWNVFSPDLFSIVIPILHPSKMIWGNYIWRYYLSHDLTKARKLAANPELLHKPDIETYIPESFEEARVILECFLDDEKLSIDIEVNNFEVSCIGFANDVDFAVSIPIDMRWTVQEEVELWNGIARIMGDPDIIKIGQNFIFDIQFLAQKMNIITRGPIIDTMMSHSILYPDFLKSLNFLASIHTMQPRWKDMVSFKDIKEDS
jgi:uracil-DNA glycosylase family 4